MTIITQWGIVGVLVAGAAWLLWDYYKNGSKKTVQSVETGFQYITDVIDRLNSIYNEVVPIRDSVSSLESRLEHLEGVVEGLVHPTLEEEGDRFNYAAKTSNLIHSAIRSNMNDIKADHLFVGILHNGTHSIHGIPFMKYDIIAEHFDVIKNPHDYDLYSRYRGNDIMIHNMLPQATIQQSYIHFDEGNMELLQKLDSMLYNRIVARCIRELVITVLIGDNNVPIGFFGAYSFDKCIQVDSFRNCGKLLEDILNDN